MCGNHSSDGTPIDHHHHGSGPSPLVLPRAGMRSRRAFLGDVGKGTLAMAVFTPAFLAACSSDDDVSAASDADATVPAAEPTDTPQDPTAAPAPESANATTDAPASDAETEDQQSAAELVWARTSLGFVSAYVLARGNRAAIVDTGSPGSAVAIGETLAGIGLNYSDVEHVILTHNHGDHAGSIEAVLAEAINATAYAGEADLGPLPQDITSLMGGEDIFGFEMLSTPGHTPGHMAAIDHQAGLLIAGDALFIEEGGAAEAPERFTADGPQSRESIKTLANLSFNTLLVGHGDPIEQGADASVAALAASF